MKLIINVVFLFLLGIISVKAQTKWTGITRSYNGNQFEVNLELDLNKEIPTGFSFSESDHFFAKIALRGTRSNQNEIFLFEKEILEISDTSLIPNMCLLQYEGSLKEKMGLTSFAGNYVGKYADGIKCDSGQFVFTEKMNLKKIRKLVKEVKAEVKWWKNEMKSGLEISMDDTLRQDQFHIFETDQKVIKISLQDFGMVDGDIVLLGIPKDQIILWDTISLLEAPTQKEIQLAQKITRFSVTAQNQGSNPPNTARIQIQDSTNHKNAISKIMPGETVYFYVKSSAFPN